jgi:hypothetical protein
MKNITYTTEHYVAAISGFYPVPVTFELLIESVINNNHSGRGMDRYLCAQLRRAGIEDELIARLLQHSPLLAYQEKLGTMNEQTRRAYIDFVLKNN